MAAPDDEDAIEAVAADGSHPALSERVRVWRSNRRPDHLDLLGAEDFVEGAAELRVAIVDQQSELRLMLAQLHGEVASLLGDPRPVRVGCAGDELEPAGRERDEEEDVDPPQRERLDREEIAGERAGSLLAQKRPPRLPSAFGLWGFKTRVPPAKCRFRAPEPGFETLHRLVAEPASAFGGPSG